MSRSARSTRILISTFTDPNGNKRTQVFRNQAVLFRRKNQSRQTIEAAKKAARDAFNDAIFETEMVWWDGDHKLKHTIATKS